MWHLLVIMNQHFALILKARIKNKLSKEKFQLKNNRRNKKTLHLKNRKKLKVVKTHRNNKKNLKMEINRITLYFKTKLKNYLLNILK